MTSDSTLSGAIFAEVIGDPVEHSRSPLIHRYWLDRLGIAAEYRQTRVRREELEAFVAARRSNPLWRGCNVTMPLKLGALMLADRKLDGAVQAGACNLLAPRDGRLVGANTDIEAVMTVIARLAVDRPTGSVTVLGSGGAARAVLVALSRMGMRRISIHARNAAVARSLSVQFGLQLQPAAIDTPVRTDALINTTPLGMSGAPPLDLDLSSIPSGGWVFDLVSTPNPTPLIVAAQRRGLAASGGLSMLVEQAASSFPHFFDAQPPRDAASDAELFERLRS
jgi:shikimate dehydrogenase